jgi:hypothetical protein
MAALRCTSALHQCDLIRAVLPDLKQRNSLYEHHFLRDGWFAWPCGSIGPIIAELNGVFRLNGLRS